MTRQTISTGKFNGPPRQAQIRLKDLANSFCCTSDQKLLAMIDETVASCLYNAYARQNETGYAELWTDGSYDERTRFGGIGILIRPDGPGPGAHRLRKIRPGVQLPGGRALRYGRGPVLSAGHLPGNPVRPPQVRLPGRLGHGGQHRRLRGPGRPVYEFPARTEALPEGGRHRPVPAREVPCRDRRQRAVRSPGQILRQGEARLISKIPDRPVHQAQRQKKERKFTKERG